MPAGIVSRGGAHVTQAALHVVAFRDSIAAIELPDAAQHAGRDVE